MEVDDLLRIARDIVDRTPYCMAATVGASGEANARVLQPGKFKDDWSVRFMTDRRSRKIGEIERTGRLTLAYQNDASAAYVTLVGRATIIDDVEVKKATWNPASLRWHPGGPTDPHVVLVEFVAERIEIWSGSHGVLPDPHKSLWAEALSREPAGWRRHQTLPSR